MTLNEIKVWNFHLTSVSFREMVTHRVNSIDVFDSKIASCTRQARWLPIENFAQFSVKLIKVHAVDGGAWSSCYGRRLTIKSCGFESRYTSIYSNGDKSLAVTYLVSSIFILFESQETFKVFLAGSQGTIPYFFSVANTINQGIIPFYVNMYGQNQAIKKSVIFDQLRFLRQAHRSSGQGIQTHDPQIVGSNTINSRILDVIKLHLENAVIVLGGHYLSIGKQFLGSTQKDNAVLQYWLLLYQMFINQR